MNALGRLFLQNAVGEFLFPILHRLNPGFDGSHGQIAIDEYRLGLSDPVRAVGGLVFSGRIPPGIVVNDGVGCRKIEPCSPCLEADQKEVRFAALKLADRGGTVLSVCGVQLNFAGYGVPHLSAFPPSFNQ